MIKLLSVHFRIYLFIVDNDGNIITRNLDHFILSGITRRRVLSLATSAGFTVQEREFDVSELMSAKEVFSTSTTLLVRPITQIGEVNIGNGICGPITRKISEMYHDFLNNI